MSRTIRFYIDGNNPAASLSGVRDIVAEHQQILSGFMDKVPAQFKPQLMELKAKADNYLAAMRDQPTDQIPGGERIGHALRWLAESITYMNEMVENSFKNLREVVHQIAPTEQALNGFKLELEKGDLIKLSDLKEHPQVKALVSDAVKAERDRFELIDKRRGLLLGAKLPVPADSKVLDGKDEEFAAVQTTAKNRLAELKQHGADVALGQDQVITLLYGSKTEYDLAINFAKKFGGKGGGATRNDSEREEPAEPLAGAPNDPAASRKIAAFV